ncbi:unnamed protein product [Symbiodinium natans]|uniref:Mono(ADP-ribosyl)transferase n=1 Tax=Symbiodinium natans TaxID=878477 RepID=A0A812SW16_9DINO|nr:unnamed protein product [Symbiodinium natans]
MSDEKLCDIVAARRVLLSCAPSRPSAMPADGTDQLPWSVIVHNAGSTAAESFEQHMRSAYSKAHLHKCILRICREVDGQDYIMKSKFRREMFRRVETVLPDQLVREFDRVLQELLQTLEETLAAAVTTVNGDDVRMPLQQCLQRLRRELNEAVQVEEMENFRKNLAAVGIVFVASFGIATAVGAGAGLGPFAAPLAIGGAAAGGVWLGSQAIWSEDDERARFVDALVEEILPTLDIGRLTRRVKSLLKSHMSSLEKLVHDAPKDPLLESLWTPVDGDAQAPSQPGASSEHGSAQADVPEQAAKKYIPFRSAVWHDPRIDNPENQSYLGLLRETYADLVCSDDFMHAAEEVKKNPLTAFTIITSGAKAKDLVPLVGKLANVTAIHVFCSNPAYHKKQPWFLQNCMEKGKVVDIYTNVGQLVNGLKRVPEMPRVAFINAEEVAASVDEAKRVYLQSDVQDYVEQTSFTEAVAYLLKLRENKHGIRAASDEGVRLAKIFDPSHGKFEELLKVYTQEDIHVYDTLNSALRVKERTQGLLKLAKLAEAFLFAMQKAAVAEPSLAFSGMTYRAMWVSDSEVAQYEASKDDFIFFRAFTSTSRDKQKAADFAERSWCKKGKRGMKLMMRIDCSTLDAGVSCVRPMSIMKFSAFAHEQEVLIPLLSGFQVVSVQRRGEFWLEVRLKLAFLMPDMTAAFIYAFL